MPGALDSVFRPLAVQLINAFGTTATWIKTAETFSATTGQTTRTETTYSVVVSPPEPYDTRRVDGSVIQVGDATCLLQGAALSFTPEIGDLITILSTRWQVIGVNPIVSGEQIAAYELQLRQ